MTSVSIGSKANPSPHSLGNKIARLLWALTHTLLFRPSPRICYRWRNLLLRLFGAHIGRDVRIHPSVKVWLPAHLSVNHHSVIGEAVDCYCVAPITLGTNVTVSQNSVLCTASHDPASSHMALITKPITLHDQSWIAADVWVGPGTTIGEGTVAGVRSTVLHDLPPWHICVGTPARPVKQRLIAP